MDNPIKTFKEKKGNRILKIYADEQSDSPRNWDNVGKMICFHKRYNLGDKTDILFSRFESWDEMKKYLIKEWNAVLIFPLYLYDHSGLRLKIGSFQGLLPQGHAYFDSGQIGFIYIDKKTLEENKLTKEKAEEILKGEVETYDEFLSGEVYGFILSKNKTCETCGHVEDETLDACWGFYGSDFKKNGLFEHAGIDISKFEELS